MSKYMITTAIPYASGKSHIGNVYERESLTLEVE